MIMRGFRNIMMMAFVALAMMFVVESCRSSKVAGPDMTIPQPTVSSVAEMRSMLRSVLSGYGEWQRMRVPVTIEVSKPKSVSISGNLTMVRDRELLIQLRYFGFEVGSLYATSDSIIVVDKVNKNYVAEAISGFLGGTDVNIGNIQDLLLGRIFSLGSNSSASDIEKDMGFEAQSPTAWMALPKAKSPTVDYGFLFSPVDVLHALVMQSGVHQPVECVYASPEATVYGPMSPSVSISYATVRTAIDARIKLNLDKCRWNDDVELRRPAITSKYKRIGSSQIENLLKKL